MFMLKEGEGQGLLLSRLTSWSHMGDPFLDDGRRCGRDALLPRTMGAQRAMQTCNAWAAVMM